MSDIASNLATMRAQIINTAGPKPYLESWLATIDAATAFIISVTNPAEVPQAQAGPITDPTLTDPTVTGSTSDSSALT